jgi:hypothetical protein
MAFTGHENHTIPIADGAAMTKNFRKGYPTQNKGVFYSKDTLQAMLDITGSVGVRFYFALDDAGKMKLVFCAVDSSENDIIQQTCGDGGALCPPACGSTNVLNS